MKIATIVSSNSHIDYVARVVDELDSANPPSPDDYGFGTFVKIEIDGGKRVVGTVYNPFLMNPEYAHYGPRLSPRPELQSFSPDFLSEQGCLLGILLLGEMGDDEPPTQAIPPSVIPPGSDVDKVNDKNFAAFHTDGGGRLSLGYFSHVLSNAGALAMPLLENIISRLSEMQSCTEEDSKRLAVLKRSLAWQRTVGQMRL